MKQFSIFPTVYFDGTVIDYFKTQERQNVFIVSDPMMKKLGVLDKLIQFLAEQGSDYQIFSEITPDPTIETITEGLKAMNQQQPDCIVAIGGGSAIDAAKGMVLANYKLDVNYQRPTFVAIPSTSGTGSEATSFTVITNGKEKKPFVDDRLLPDVAILDTALVKTVPPRISADTGMDVLTHAIEAYVSLNANTFSDALAEKAIQLVFDSLITVYRDPNDQLARDKMHKASCLAGMAFTNTSLGINHSLAHAIGGIFHLPHGRINAIIMPGVIGYNAGLDSQLTETASRYQEIASLLKLPAGTPREGTENLMLAIKYMNEALEIEQNFSKCQITDKEYVGNQQQIIELALADACTMTNPRQPDTASLTELYRSFYQ
ncbi:1-propanol dehydrogenase PduQ [Amphibacillus sp. Q70]|uniref:1-propanol dehydrogenase PduQ n=1 Tax=Amphibacillus sp. Q70 TaxID=3453416 RepID=UPI003F825AF4